MKKCILLLLLFVCYSSCFAQSDGAGGFFKTHYLNKKILTPTDYGNTIDNGKQPEKPEGIPSGSDYVHLFFDEYGNAISNMPVGIPWVSYVVHIIRPKTTKYTYSVNQTGGALSGVFVVQGASASATAENVRGVQVQAESYTENIYTLSPSDNASIVFDLIRQSIDSTGTITKGTLATYTIAMSSYSNASIDVGILNSKLANPVYTNVNSPAAAGTTVVKASGGGDRVMTTVMGTIYFSPIVFIEKEIFNIDIPKFKIKGRSAIADHKIYERIYPTFGLSINDNSFQNIFYGINWEVIRGASLFLGFHTGKINTYNTTPGFVFGTTAVTADQFTYNSDMKWATKFAVGATIDLKVVLGLLSTQVK